MIKRFGNYLISLVVGMKIGVYMVHKDVFNSKVPIWVCWIIGILTVPLNILTFPILMGKNKLGKDYRKDFKKYMNEMKEEGRL